jgi:hypothetical protein
VFLSPPLDWPDAPDPVDLPELEVCPGVLECGEIWPLLVPVLPALTPLPEPEPECSLPLPDPPG